MQGSRSEGRASLVGKDVLFRRGVQVNFQLGSSRRERGRADTGNGFSRRTYIDICRTSRFDRIRIVEVDRIANGDRVRFRAQKLKHAIRLDRSGGVAGNIHKGNGVPLPDVHQFTARNVRARIRPEQVARALHEVIRAENGDRNHRNHQTNQKLFHRLVSCFSFFNRLCHSLDHPRTARMNRAGVGDNPTRRPPGRRRDSRLPPR